MNIFSNTPSGRSTFATILYALGGVVTILLVVIAMQPNEFYVSRSETISASASQIFPHVNNLRKFNEWSPWAKMDPHAKHTFAGTTEGAGAIMHWEGKEVGKGSMTIDESCDNEFVEFKMEFLKPIESSSTAEFTFKQEGRQTVVTWSMHGKNNFIGKAMGLIFNCEKMCGEQFEKGLKSLKTLVEA